MFLRGRLGIRIGGLVGVAISPLSNQEMNPCIRKTEFNMISIEKAAQPRAQSYPQMRFNLIVKRLAGP